MKRIITISLTAASLSCASYAFAGGPDSLSTGGLNSHWYAGVLGGLAINIANSEASYTNSALSTSQNFDTTAYDSSFITGLNVGYAWDISHTNQISLSANVNYDIAANITDIWHIDSNIASSDAMDLKNSVKPQWQYNLLLSLIHDLGDSFSVGATAGFSVLNTKTSLVITDVGSNTAGSQAVPGNNSEQNYLVGGILGLKASFLTSKNSSLDFNVDYYVYATKNLSNVAPIETGINDSLIKRKLYLSLPVLALGYTYHF